MMMLSFAYPALAFFHPDGTDDKKYEIFGPRLDRIQFVKYSGLDAEVAGLQGGEIDITEWALTPSLEATLEGDPNIVIGNYGGEAGYYPLSFNCNNNTYLGNPPNPAFPNPALPNPTADVWFRRALSHTIDPAGLVATVGGGFDPIYTPIPAYMFGYIHPDIAPGGLYEDLTYPFDPTYAVPNAILDAHHFPREGGVGQRYMDMNENNVKDAGEDFTLQAYTRYQDALRLALGDQEEAGLIALHINYVRHAVTSAQAQTICMQQKNYHTYTAGWIGIGPDPDYMYDLYSYDNYYHDGVAKPPNIAAIGKYDPVNEEALKRLKFASDNPTAVTAALDFQYNFATMAYEKPAASTAAPKAWNKWYTGGNDGAILGTDDGENQYRGDNWDDIVNQAGFGVNSFWSTLNMFPVGHPYGDGSHMTVREGWQQLDMPAVVNPVYSSWYWESEVWTRVVDGGGARDPYTLLTVSVPQLFENWTVGTWVDPADGITKAAITVRMRPDILWNTGVKCTIDDFIYTLVQLPAELKAKNCTDVWWQPTLDQVAGAFKLDNSTAQILMKVDTMFAVNWIVGNAILPKYWWQPFIAANTKEDIEGDLGPGNVVGTGPFLYSANAPDISATMVRNPLYWQQDEVGVIKEDPQSGIEFTAQAPSTQLSPVRIKDANITSIGPDGWFNVKVTVSNLNRYQSVTFDETITLTYAGPNAPGAPTVLSPTASHTLAPGATFVYTQLMHVRDGLHRVDVTVQKSGGAARTVSKFVFVTVLGDLTGDWKANILDITQIAIRFGSIRGDTRYDPIADVNHDSKINILDIVQVALVFGWTAIGP
jgi:ABC-type transport system substrate-binding protein